MESQIGKNLTYPSQSTGESNDKFEEYIMEDYDDIELIFVSK